MCYLKSQVLFEFLSLGMDNMLMKTGTLICVKQTKRIPLAMKWGRGRPWKHNYCLIIKTVLKSVRDIQRHIIHY